MLAIGKLQNSFLNSHKFILFNIMHILKYYFLLNSRLIFGIGTCDRKVLLSRLVGFVCERSAQAMVMADSGAAGNKSSSQNDLTTSALMILSEINRKYPTEMKYNGLQIMVNIEI